MPLGPVASNEMWDAIYDRLVELVAQHRSTLVFVNTRRMAERLCMSWASASAKRMWRRITELVAQTAAGGGEEIERGSGAGAGGDGLA